MNGSWALLKRLAIVVSASLGLTSAPSQASNFFEASECQSSANSQSWCGLYSLSKTNSAGFDNVFFGGHDPAETIEKVRQAQGQILRDIEQSQNSLQEKFRALEPGQCLTFTSERPAAKPDELPAPLEFAEHWKEAAVIAANETALRKRADFSATVDYYFHSHPEMTSHYKPGGQPLLGYHIGCAKSREEFNALADDVYEMLSQVAMDQFINWRNLAGTVVRERDTGQKPSM